MCSSVENNHSKKKKQGRREEDSKKGGRKEKKRSKRKAGEGDNIGCKPKGPKPISIIHIHQLIVCLNYKTNQI